MRILVQEPIISPTHSQLNFKNGSGLSKAPGMGREVEEPGAKASGVIVDCSRDILVWTILHFEKGTM